MFWIYQCLFSVFGSYLFLCSFTLLYRIHGVQVSILPLRNGILILMKVAVHKKYVALLLHLQASFPGYSFIAGQLIIQSHKVLCFG